MLIIISWTCLLSTCTLISHRPWWTRRSRMSVNFKRRWSLSRSRNIPRCRWDRWSRKYFRLCTKQWSRSWTDCPGPQNHIAATCFPSYRKADHRCTGANDCGRSCSSGPNSNRFANPARPGVWAVHPPLVKFEFSVSVKLKYSFKPHTARAREIIDFFKICLRVSTFVLQNRFFSVFGAQRGGIDFSKKTMC